MHVELLVCGVLSVRAVTATLVYFVAKPQVDLRLLCYTTTHKTNVSIGSVPEQHITCK